MITLEITGNGGAESMAKFLAELSPKLESSDPSGPNRFATRIDGDLIGAVWVVSNP